MVDFIPPLSKRISIPLPPLESLPSKDGDLLISFRLRDGLDASSALGQPTYQVWTNLPPSASPGDEESGAEAGGWRAVSLAVRDVGGGENVEVVSSPPSVTLRLGLDDKFGFETYEYTYRALYPDGGIDWLGNGGTNGVVEVRLAALQAEGLDDESWEKVDTDWVLKGSEGTIVLKGLVKDEPRQVQPEPVLPAQVEEEEATTGARSDDQHSILSSLPTTSSLLSSSDSTHTTDTSTTTLPDSSSTNSFAPPIGAIKSTSSHVPNQSSISSTATFQTDRGESSSGSHSPGTTTPATSLPTSPAMGKERDLFGGFGGVMEPLPVELKAEDEGDDVATIKSAAGAAVGEEQEDEGEQVDGDGDRDEEKKPEVIERAIESTIQEPLITGPSSEDDTSTSKAIAQSNANAPDVPLVGSVKKDELVPAQDDEVDSNPIDTSLPIPSAIPHREIIDDSSPAPPSSSLSDSKPVPAKSSTSSDIKAIPSEIIDKLPSIPSLPNFKDVVPSTSAITNKLPSPSNPVQERQVDIHEHDDETTSKAGTEDDEDDEAVGCSPASGTGGGGLAGIFWGIWNLFLSLLGLGGSSASEDDDGEGGRKKAGGDHGHDEVTTDEGATETTPLLTSTGSTSAPVTVAVTGI